MTAKKIISALLATTVLVLTCSCASGKPADKETDSTDTEPNDISVKNTKTYAADSLLDENGNFGNNDGGELTVAFIGGSLTEGDSYNDAMGLPVGGNEWTTLFCKYLVERFPNKFIRPVNSGVGGTTSDYGAMRFQKTVLNYSPDIIFIEFSVNDTGYADNVEFVQSYTENMIRAAKALDKEPVIVFLHAPNPIDRELDKDYYDRWASVRDNKNKVADWYNIGTVDIYDYLYRKYEASGIESIYDFLAGYYFEGASSMFDVHGGYRLYYEAIVESLEKDAKTLIHRMADPETGYENDLYKNTYEIKFNYVSPIDPRISRSDGWNHYDESNINTREYDETDSHPLNGVMFTARKNDAGVLETTKGGEFVSFTTKADELWVLYPTVADGNTAKVYVDGTEIDEITSMSVYVGMTYIIKLPMPADGKEHEVKFVTNEPKDGNNYFRFGYIVELTR